MSRHVLITGASSGIGRELARQFARDSGSLTLVARRGDLLRELAAEVDCSVTVLEQDLRRTRSSIESLTAALQDAPPIDLLINNAGVAPILPYPEMSAEHEQAVLNVDLRTPIELVRAVLPSMIARGSGAIVNITSIAALLPTPYMSVYNAAKAGLAAFSESLRTELGRRGVRVLTVYPGVIDTPLAAAGYAAHGHARIVTSLPTGTTSELAKRIRRALERGSKRLIYPVPYKIAWWLPWLARPLLARAVPPPVEPTPTDPETPLGYTRGRPTPGGRNRTAGRQNDE